MRGSRAPVLSATRDRGFLLAWPPRPPTQAASASAGRAARRCGRCRRPWPRSTRRARGGTCCAGRPSCTCGCALTVSTRTMMVLSSIQTRRPRALAPALVFGLLEPNDQLARWRLLALHLRTRRTLAGGHASSSVSRRAEQGRSLSDGLVGSSRRFGGLSGGFGLHDRLLGGWLGFWATATAAAGSSTTVPRRPAPGQEERDGLSEQPPQQVLGRSLHGLLDLISVLTFSIFSSLI